MDFIEEAIKLIKQGRGPNAGQTPMATTTFSRTQKKDGHSFYTAPSATPDGSK